MSQGLILRFTRTTPSHHRFEYRRPDGTGEAIEMETRGLLTHDLLHFAVESEAHLKGSFYGILGKIGGYEELVVAGGTSLGGEIAITERVVGALTEALKADEVDPDGFIDGLTDDLELFDERPPRWLTAEFVLAVTDRMRRLESEWKAQPVGQAMELVFEI